MQQQAERLAHLMAKAHPLRHLNFPPRYSNNQEMETEEEEEEKAKDLAGGSASFLADQLAELETCLRARRALVDQMRQHMIPDQPEAASVTLTDLMSVSMRQELISPDVGVSFAQLLALLTNNK